MARLEDEYGKVRMAAAGALVGQSNPAQRGRGGRGSTTRGRGRLHQNGRPGDLGWPTEPAQGDHESRGGTARGRGREMSEWPPREPCVANRTSPRRL